MIWYDTICSVRIYSICFIHRHRSTQRLEPYNICCSFFHLPCKKNIRFDHKHTLFVHLHTSYYRIDSEQNSIYIKFMNNMNDIENWRKECFNKQSCARTYSELRNCRTDVYPGASAFVRTVHYNIMMRNNNHCSNALSLMWQDNVWKCCIQQER